jgi:predicted transcriptional regulator
MTAYTVQIEKTLAARLERAAHTAKISPVELITECVAQHLDSFLYQPK